MILRNGELLSLQNGIMRYHYCEFSKNGENTKNDDLPTVWKCRPYSQQFQVSSLTKERYNQCQNINCSHTFVTHETFVRSIATPKESNPVQPHPMKSGQVALSL